MSEIKPDKTVDLKWLNCPMPVIKAKKALGEIEPGQVLEVYVTDPGSKTDIPALLKRTGNELLQMKDSDGVITFLIKKGTL